MSRKFVFQTTDTNEITRAYLDSILVEERLLDASLPELHTEIFGKKFDSPIMTPAFSHLHHMEDNRDGMLEYTKAAKQQNILNWTGMETDDSFGEIIREYRDTVRIIKPFADREKIYQQMEFAEKNGAFAVGIDIDHSFGGDGKFDVVDGEVMGPVSTSELKKFVDAVKLPFIIKGVLSVSDAEKCAECGVKGIVVSHHHGRMPFAVPPLMVLPDIQKELSGTGVQIFVDCHMDSGVDAFKAIALGADAVSVGRAMLDGLQAEGTSGVVKKIRKMNEELAMMMGYTGFALVGEIERSVLWNY